MALWQSYSTKFEVWKWTNKIIEDGQTIFEPKKKDVGNNPNLATYSMLFVLKKNNNLSII